MKSARKARTLASGPNGVSAFNAEAFLKSTGVAKRVAQYGRGDTVFTQGDACEHVMYIQAGGVKLSVLSKTGREAVVAMLGPGDFFGEGYDGELPLEVNSCLLSVVLHD